MEPEVTEAEARAIVRREGRRMMWLSGVSLLVALLLYLLIGQLLLDRPPAQSVNRIWPVLVGVVLLSYVFQVPRWAKRRTVATVRARVGRVGDAELILQGGPDGEVSLRLPRGTSGFRRGDEVWVSPDLRAGETLALVVPTHVTSARPVLSGRTRSVTARG